MTETATVLDGQVEAFPETAAERRSREIATGTKLRAGGRIRQITQWEDPGTRPWLWPGSGRLGHAGRVCRFIERYVKVPTGHGRGQPFRLRPWQETDIRRLYGSDRDANRAAMLSISRGNGKTGLAGALTVAELFLIPGAEVLTLATNERQAAIPYFRALESLERSPILLPHAVIYADRSDPTTLLPHRAARMFPLPAAMVSALGYEPTFAVIDETGFIDEGTWIAIQGAGGKHPRSLLLGIGTPGFDRGIMYRYREQATSSTPAPHFAFVEHSAPLSWDPGKAATWRRANPALGDFLAIDALELDHATFGLNTFRTFRLGQWADREAAWMPADTWDALEVIPGEIPDGSPITLGFDGSVAIDSTGLVAFDVALQRLVMLELWERPKGDRRWKVPRADVRAAIERAFTRWNVVQLYADPHYFRDMLEDLGEQYPDRVTEWATNARIRMAAATDRFATMAYNRAFSWDGSEALRRHVLAANAEVTPAGDVIRKRADRPQPIDLAVCSILAIEAAATIEPPAEYAIY